MRVDLTSQGVTWELDSSISTWHSTLPIQAATALNEFLVDHPELLQQRSFSVLADIVATWSETAALQLGLPANCPLAFDVRLSGAMGKPGAQIIVRWLQPGKTVTARDVTADGLWLNYQGKAYLLYAQRLNGVDILDQVRRVEQLYYQFDCSMIGSDRGVGVLQGQLLQQNIGKDRVSMINYVAAKHHLRWIADAGFYAADRTMSIDTMILKAKMGPGRFETPCWDLTQEFWNDALALTEEETQAGRRVYRREEGVPDDWAHSITFANIAYMVVKGDFVFVDSGATIAQDSPFNF